MNNQRRFLLAVLCVGCSTIGSSAFGDEPLTLKQAITLALQNSSELAAARARHAVAEQQASQARAPFRPGVFAGSGVAYTNGFPMTPAGSAPSIFDVAFTQTLYNPPLNAQARAAAAKVEVERLGLEQSMDAVILRTAVVFLDLAQVREALDVRRGAREAIRRVQDITRSRVAEGRELPVESLRAELAAAQGEQHIVELEGREDALASELRALTGLRTDQRLEVLPDTLAAEPEESTDALVALALSRNTELQQVDYERRARADRVKGERAGYWPSVDLVGEYAMLARINNYDEFFRTFQRHNLNLGVQLRWPLFSAQTNSAVRLADAELRQIEADQRRKREEIELTVRRNSQHARELKAARDVARVEVMLAQENVRMMQERFAGERANLRDVERARLEASDKRVAFLQADYDSQQAQLELLKSTGQLGRLLL